MLAAGTAAVENVPGGNVIVMFPPMGKAPPAVGVKNRDNPVATWPWYMTPPLRNIACP